MNNHIILLAEDDENDVFLVQRAFAKVGIGDRLRVVNNGAQAMAYLKGEGEFGDRARFPMPSLLLLDLKMPFKNGFEVLEAIRADSDLSHLIVVVLTSSSQKSDVVSAYALGVNSYLVKPAVFEELVRLLGLTWSYWMENNRV